MADPLEHPGSGLRSTLTIARLAVVACVLHLLILSIFFAANHVLASNQKVMAPERVKVRIVENRTLPPPPPPPPEPRLEAAKPRVVDEAKPRPVPLAKVRPPRPQEAPPDPIAKPVEAAPSAPRRVVGLSLESTVQGGQGPAFAVGSTRMGETGPAAVAPEVAKREAEAPPPNRVSTRFEEPDAPIVRPRRLTPVSPIYPQLLRERGIEADVVVVVTIGVDGKVTNVEIAAPASDAAFNEAALAAAKAERYEPATRAGEPLPFTQRFTIRFRLND